MPRGDRMGPMGMGPMTGGGRGECVEIAGNSETRQRSFDGRFSQKGGRYGFRKSCRINSLLRKSKFDQSNIEEDRVETLKFQANKIQSTLSSMLERICILEKLKSE